MSGIDKKSVRLRIENCPLVSDTRRSVLLLTLPISMKRWGKSQIAMGSGMKDGEVE